MWCFKTDAQLINQLPKTRGTAILKFRETDNRFITIFVSPSTGLKVCSIAYNRISVVGWPVLIFRKTELLDCWYSFSKPNSTVNLYRLSLTLINMANIFKVRLGILKKLPETVIHKDLKARKYLIESKLWGEAPCGHMDD